MPLTESQMGVAAYKAGEPVESNPFPRNSEESGAWADGYRSMMPARTADAREVQDAEQYDVSRFRRKSNRHYS